MPDKHRFRARTATWMSVLALVLALLSPRTLSAAPPAAVVGDDLDARHRVGLQLGGSSFVQLVYRLRLLGHSYLELGGAGAPEGTMNASAGLMVALRTGTRFFPYAAGGVGFGVAGGGPGPSPDEASSCVDGTKSCPWESSGVSYGYARAGVGMTFGVNHNASVLLDFGAWKGTRWHWHDDGMGTLTDVSEPFVWPMPGLAMFASF
jgi:hypothetical protein